MSDVEAGFYSNMEAQNRPAASSSDELKTKNLTSNNDPTIPQFITSTTSETCQGGSKKRLALYKRVMRYSKPLNIMVIGAAGAGKSSFINSCIRAVRKESGQWVSVGSGGDMPHVTTVLRRINMYFPDADNPRIKQEGLVLDAPDAGPIQAGEAPSFIDVCGMPDENTELVRTVLRLLLYGHFKLDEHNFLDMQANVNPHQALNLFTKYPISNEHLVIHRVIVVASAKGDLPRELIKAVMETARPTTHLKDGVISRRAIPVFGLMTKVDLVEADEPSFKSRKQEFIKCLGLRGSARNFSLCRNYVSEDNSENEDLDSDDNDSSIDETILKFMCNVCDPTHHIDNPEWRLEKETLSMKMRVRWERQRYYCYMGLVLLLLCVLCFTYIGKQTFFVPLLTVLFLWWVQT